MHPILFEIPGLGLPIRSFGVMVVLGFLLASHLFTRWYFQRTTNGDEDARGIGALPLWVMVGVVGGARAAYVLVESLQGSETGQRYLNDPLSMLYVWEGGLVMYGGCFGAIFGGWLCVRKYALPFTQILDLTFVGAFFGLSIGRIGCLLVGDDHGSIVPDKWSHLPFPITVDVPSLEWLEANPDSLFPHELASQTIWATQPWMTINALALGVIGIWFLRQRAYRGQVVLRLLALYSIGRFCIEIFRGDSIRGLWFNDTISTSQLVSILLFTFCVSMLFKNRRRQEPEPLPQTDPVAND
jgi:phosphatidylglycerol:prolipoprotein diacylglycerol transferase